MASGLSPKLPLMRHPEDGFALNKNYNSMIIQNMKMLVLTSPGERVMIPDFGVGLKNFLFENIGESTFKDIRAKIIEQTREYMPFVRIIDIQINPISEGFADNNLTNYISVKIKFSVDMLELISEFEINVSQD